LSHLPREIIRHVARALWPQDIEALAGTNRELRYTLTNENRSAGLFARARRVRTTDEARALLSEIQTDLSSPRLQTPPLVVLARTINPEARLTKQQSLILDWPATEHAALSDGIWTAMVQLPPYYQAEVLEAFAPTMHRLPDRFDASLHRIVQLPQELWPRPLASLAEHIPYGTSARQRAMYDAVFEQAQQLPAQRRSRVLGKLMPLLPYISESTVRLHDFLEATRQLPAHDQIGLLNEIPTYVRLLPENDQPAACEHAMQIIEQLAPQQRTLPLKAFALQILHLAEPLRAIASENVLRLNGGPVDMTPLAALG
jgi:hypothetical protein